MPSGFEGFRESPDAPFYCAPGRSPEDTWAEAENRLARVLDGLGGVPADQLAPITVDRIVRWRGAIFATTFPHDAGRLRDDYEPVRFSLATETDAQSGRLVLDGAMPRAELVGRLAEACSAFNVVRES